MAASRTRATARGWSEGTGSGIGVRADRESNICAGTGAKEAWWQFRRRIEGEREERNEEERVRE